MRHELKVYLSSKLKYLMQIPSFSTSWHSEKRCEKGDATDSIIEGNVGNYSDVMMTFYMFNTINGMRKTVEGNTFVGLLVLLLPLHHHNNVELGRCFKCVFFNLNDCDAAYLQNI